MNILVPVFKHIAVVGIIWICIKDFLSITTSQPNLRHKESFLTMANGYSLKRILYLMMIRPKWKQSCSNPKPLKVIMLVAVLMTLTLTLTPLSFRCHKQ